MFNKTIAGRRRTLLLFFYLCRSWKRRVGPDILYWLFQKYPDIPYSKISGSSVFQKYPDLPYSKISGSSVFQKYPDLPYSKISGSSVFQKYPDPPYSKIIWIFYIPKISGYFVFHIRGWPSRPVHPTAQKQLDPGIVAWDACSGVLRDVISQMVYHGTHSKQICFMLSKSAEDHGIQRANFPLGACSLIRHRWRIDNALDDETSYYSRKAELLAKPNCPPSTWWRTVPQPMWTATGIFLVHSSFTRSIKGFLRKWGHW